MSQQKLLLPLLLLLCLTITNGSGQSLPNGSTASFTLSEKAATSAGVYKQDGTLVRTLWSGVVKGAGTHEVKWDGTDDRLQPLPVDNYTFKILSNNVQYKWEGAIGNTSLGQYGRNIHTSFESFNKMVITGSKAYYSVGYNEGNASVAAFDLNNVQVRLDPYNGYGGWVSTDEIGTDGTNIYMMAIDNYNRANTFLYARKISDNSIVNFSTGRTYQGRNIFFNSVIDFRSTSYVPTGITVSPSYLFVAYKAGNIISVLDKTTGALVREISIASPTSLSVDGSSIWITTNNNTIKKFALNSDGSLGADLTTITGLSDVVDMKVNGSILGVVDGGISQQVKAFNTSSGSAEWTLGQHGGMKTSPLVQDDRFAFWRIHGDGLKHNRGGICFATDGSFWVIDPSNARMQHYDSNRNLREQIMYLQNTRTCSVVGNNNKRVLGNAYEFEIDYTKALTSGWKMKYNWEGNLNNFIMEDWIKSVNTLSNGRTYGLVVRTTGNPNGRGGGTQIVELNPTTGIRYTGKWVNDIGGEVKMYGDGSIIGFGGNGINETTDWGKMTLSGFDGNNDPVYSKSSLPATYPVKANEPRLSGPKSYPYEKTSSNILVLFKGDIDAGEEGAYHFGGMDATTGKVMFRTSMSTFKGYRGEFPSNGDFDIGNGVGNAGNVAMAHDRSIIWGYHGEFWKGSQVNKYNHYYDNGLFLGQFGNTGPEYNDDPVNNAGFAGNAFMPQLIKEGEDYYLYHNDESVHGGLHRWKITGLNTIQEHSTNIGSSFERTDENPLPTGVVDLMVTLPGRQQLANNNATGWTITQAPGEEWYATTSVNAYDKRKNPDLNIVYNGKTSVTDVSRSLGANSNLTNWHLSGKISYNGTNPNYWNGHGTNAFFDVLDNTGKIIVRVYQISDVPHANTIFTANNTAIFTKQTATMQQFTRLLKDLSIYKSGSAITVSYAGETITISDVYEAGANMSNPTTMRLYFDNGNASGDAKVITIDGFTFNSSDAFTTPTPPTVIADDAANMLSATHRLGSSEILISENDGDFVGYSGSINVGNVRRPSGYWKFKIKAAPERNVSLIVNSPAFAEDYTSQCSATGTILHEVWNNVNGLSIGSNDWSKKPDNTSPLKMFEAQSNIGDNYAARIRGYLCPPQTGNYTFFISGDDATELWLSTDANPANKQKIAHSDVATRLKLWSQYPSQKSFQVYLQGGNKYYIEALHKENNLDDFLAVAWQLPDGNLEAPIPGSRLSPFDADFEKAPVTPCSATGSILHEVWNNVNGLTINSNNWSNKPDNTSPLTLFEAQSNIGENYAARIRGYICPPQTGNYTFFIAGDDATELWLSTDANPENKRKIAYSVIATYARNWEQYNSQKSFQVYLRAGSKYYIEALHKEASGGDHFAVAWRLPNGDMEAPIQGSRLSPFDAEPIVASVTPCSATGTILHEKWNNVNGSAISSNNWSNKPDNTSSLTVFEAASNTGENYASRIRGYICPPQSGNYTFWIAGDDAVELWLSTSADPTNKKRIAYNNSWTLQRNWNQYESQKSAQVYMVEGNKYYIEALHKEAGGGDYFAVAWQLPNGALEAPIPGSRLSPFSPNSNLILAPDLTGQCSATGSILSESWSNVSGLNISDNDWTKKPNSTNPVTSFQAPKNIADLYATRIKGYICPPQSGNYTFWVSGDDATELWLSLDANPLNKIKIAYNTDYTGPNDWNRYSSQKSAQVFLQAGKKYYIEALLKENYGEDNLSVSWQLPNGSVEAPIPGSRLSPYTSSETTASEQSSKQAINLTDGRSNNISLHVYPNPIISNNVFIQSENMPVGKYAVSLLNEMGQIVYNNQITHSGGYFKYSLPVSQSLSKGLYMLNLVGKDVKFSKKLVK